MESPVSSDEESSESDNGLDEWFACTSILCSAKYKNYVVERDYFTLMLTNYVGHLDGQVARHAGRLAPDTCTGWREHAATPYPQPNVAFAAPQLSTVSAVQTITPKAH